jgi:hypothetical protein
MKHKSYNPFKLWGFYIGAIFFGIVSRLVFGKGKIIELWQKCITEGCIHLGISLNTLYGVLVGFVVGYLLHISLRKKK